MTLTPQTMGILVGGLMPALFFGLSGVLLKATSNVGIGIAFLIGIIGIGAIITAVGIFVIPPDKTLSLHSAGLAIVTGIVWGIANAGVALAIAKYGMPLSKLAPLYNINTLVAALLSLWIFAEWQYVHTPKLLFGTLLIVLGGALVSQS